MSSTLVVIPTYQEAQNIEACLRAVRDAGAADILVVDDGSPDGTADLAEKVGADIGGVEIFRRETKNGLGEAYRAAFARALAGDHRIIIQMDSDLSHDPAVIPQLIAAIDDGADCSIGSRYVPGGSTPGWPFYRRALSRYGNLYTGAMLDLGIKDATSGYRAYRADALRGIRVEETRSTGYAFMSEVASRLVRNGARIVEVPITFEDRRFGTSKMSTKIIVESMLRVTRNGISQRIADRRRGRG